MSELENKHPQLKEYRDSIDNIDATLVFLLAERFKITKKVGHYKKEHDLPPGDPGREKRQIAQLRDLAETAHLDQEIGEKFLQFITKEVIKRHEHIRNGSS